MFDYKMPWQVLVSITNVKLTAGVVFLKLSIMCRIMVSNISRDNQQIVNQRSGFYEKLKDVCKFSVLEVKRYLKQIFYSK